MSQYNLNYNYKQMCGSMGMLQYTGIIWVHLYMRQAFSHINKCKYISILPLYLASYAGWKHYISIFIQIILYSLLDLSFIVKTKHCGLWKDRKRIKITWNSSFIRYTKETRPVPHRTASKSPKFLLKILQNIYKHTHL